MVAATGVMVAASPFLPVAAAQETISGGDSVTSVAELAAGTLEVDARDRLYFDVNIPVGQRLHVAYAIDPDQAPGSSPPQPATGFCLSRCSTPPKSN